MATGKVERKTAILISPYKLNSDFALLDIIYIQRTKTTMEYDVSPFTMSAVRKIFFNLQKPMLDALTKFDAGAIGRLSAETKSTLKNAADAGMYRQSMLRQIHGLFEQVKPFASLLKFYQRIPADAKRYKISPCTFSNFRPQLSFDVQKAHGLLKVIPFITLNNSPYPITDFNRYEFLLESGGEYFLMLFKDYQILEWLQQPAQQQYGNQPAEFAQHILARLEADYPVERNNLFAQHVVEAAPVNRVLLSELSGSFLMFTPQWLYDNFLVDGPYKETVEFTTGGNAYTIKRNEKAETDFVQLLVDLHPDFKKQLSKGYFYVSFAEAQKKQWFLKTYHKLLELNIELAGMDMLQHFRYSPHKVDTTVQVKDDSNNNLSLQISVKFGSEEVPLPELQKMLLAGQRAVLLKDGSLGVLGDDWHKQYSAIIKHGKVNKKELHVAKWMALSEQQHTDAEQVLKPVIAAGWWKKWRQWQEPETVVYQVPALVKAALRPYQQKGFEWLTLLAEAGAGGCLADDMGLGKTLQTICFISQFIHNNPASKNLIICPSSLIYNWQNEWQKFAPGVTIEVYHGPHRDMACLSNGTQVVVSSYGTVRSDVEKMQGIEFGIVVVDESHNIKNPSAQITRAVGLLQAQSRVALSGTPVMNNTFDLYAQLNFVLPGMFGSREFFKREYADAIDRNQDTEKVQALQKLTAPFILRRTKEQVATDLPPKTESILWCQMGVAQKELYEEVKESIASSIFLDIKTQGLGKSKLNVLAGIQKLRQICCSPVLLKDAPMAVSDSVKTDMLMEELGNNIGGHKALVFSQFKGMLHTLADACGKKGIPYFHFDGDTPVEKRQEMVTAFQQEDSATKVFLISLKAGNAGLNLTAADYVFLVDPWWNQAVENQAIDRTHRIGQKQHVFAYRMICKDTIEEKIIALQQRKKKIAEDLVTEDEGFVKALSEEDIAYLFS